MAGELVQTGVQVDHYRLEARIGSGSSGEVWRAHDGVRAVAIKFMNPALLNGDDAEKHRQRFHTEVHALESLGTHPHIPTLYGYNLYYERPYLVMEHITGLTYAELIASGEMMLKTLRERLDLLDTVANTITYIHNGGFIHRDIKPANIRGEDHLYITDFSIAIERGQAVNADPNIGTAIYMPPTADQPPGIEGDNFSFVLVAYEMLFGQHAVFKPGGTGGSLEATRRLLGQIIAAGSWHKPSQLSIGEIPGSLRGVDLEQLDAVFERALRDYRQDAALDQFLADLREIVEAPENQPYLDYVPTIPPVGDTIPEEEDYTLHEVQNAHQSTDLNLSQRPQRRERSHRWRRQNQVWTILVILLVVIALVMMFFVIVRVVS
jgi:serine/threonine protein kinase